MEQISFGGFIVLLGKGQAEKGLFSFGGLVANGILLYQRRKAVLNNGKLV